MSRRKFLNNAITTSIGLSLGGGALFAPNILKAQTPILHVLAPSALYSNEIIEYLQTSINAKIQITAYKNEFQIINNLKSSNINYDLIICSHFTGMILKKHELIQPIQWGKIKNISVYRYDFEINDYDPLREFSILFAYQFWSLAFNTKLTYQKPISWGAIFDSIPTDSQINWSQAPMDLIKTACLYLGFGINNTNRSNFNIVEDMLITSLPMVKKIPFSLNVLGFEFNQVDIAFATTNQIQNAINNYKNIGAAFPKEGVPVYETIALISKDSSQIELVHSLINLLLNPLVGKAIAEDSCLLNPFERVIRLTSNNYQTNKIINPSLNKLIKLEPIRTFDIQTYNYMQDMWARIISNAKSESS